MPRHALIPLIVACALFMENLDGTVIATSLPAIAADLREDPISLKLALTSYLLSLAVFIPISGWLADRYGARHVFRAAIAVFMLGSIACGFSTSLWEFVAARVLQGMGGAMMTPVGRLVILRSVPKSEMIGALAWLTVPALTGPLMGPPLGGFITTYFDWRWIFFINVPIALIGLALATFYIPDIREPERPPLDLRGLALCVIGLSGLMFGFAVVGQNLVPLAYAVGITLTGAAAMVLYVRHARRTVRPVIDLALLSIPTFRAAVIGASFFRIGVGAAPFLLPLMLQLGFGLTPFASGMISFAVAGGALLMKTTAAPIIRRFGFRRILIAMALTSGAFLAANALFTAQTPHWVIICVLFAGGFFRSLEFTAINAIAYADIEPAAMSRATSFASVAQQVSISIGVAIGAAVLETVRALKAEPVIEAADFAVAFIVVGAICTISAIFFARLSPDAGAVLSGQAGKDPPASQISDARQP